MGKLTWRYNTLGDIEVWKGELNPTNGGDSDLYIQGEDDVKLFFDNIGVYVYETNEWDFAIDPGYFID